MGHGWNRAQYDSVYDGDYSTRFDQLDEEHAELTNSFDSVRNWVEKERINARGLCSRSIPDAGKFGLFRRPSARWGHLQQNLKNLTRHLFFLVSFFFFSFFFFPFFPFFFLFLFMNQKFITDWLKSNVIWLGLYRGLTRALLPVKWTALNELLQLINSFTKPNSIGHKHHAVYDPFHMFHDRLCIDHWMGLCIAISDLRIKLKKSRAYQQKKGEEVGGGRRKGGGEESSINSSLAF